jgi:hypothetical protein
MKKLVMSATMLAMLAAPAFAQTHQRNWRQPVNVEQSQAMRAQAAAPRDFGYAIDHERATLLSPGSPSFETDYNR